MKLTTLALSMALATLLGGCSDLLAFDLHAEVDEFNVQGDIYLNQGGAPLDLAEVPPIEFQYGAIQGDSVTLAQLDLFVTETSVLTEGDDDDLDFLTSVKVYVTPLDDTVDLPTLEIATWKRTEANGKKSIRLMVNPDIDLKPYIRSGMRVKLQPFGVVPADDVSVSGAATFRVVPF